MSHKADIAKLEVVVAKMVEDTLAVGKTVGMFDQRILLNSMHVSSLKIRHLHDEISDIFTYTSFCEKYGKWETGEYESHVRYLVRLSAPGQQLFSDAAHYLTFEEAAKVSGTPKTETVELPKGVSVEQAQQALAALATQNAAQ